MTIVFSCLIALVAITFLSLRVLYPASLRSAHRISSSGIDLMETVDIGGIQQALCFRGQNIDNPVILYLHGGPGSPMAPLLHIFQYRWEQYFTIVHWDQRNSGKTFFANDPEAVRTTVTGQRVVLDAHEVTQYVKKKLVKDRIIVLGHSWGSVLGTMLVQTYPEDYSAYIGIGQCINMVENERLGYEKALETARVSGNKKNISALEALDPYPSDDGYDETFNDKVTILRKYQEKNDISWFFGVKTIISIFASPYYTLPELLYYLKDALYYQSDLLRFLLEEYDIYNFGTEYKMPVYYIMGENDWTTPFPLAENYFSDIIAPYKAFFSIPRAGHAPMVQNRAEFDRVLLEVIRSQLSTKDNDNSPVSRM